SKFVGGLSGHNLAAKGGIKGRWSGRLCRPDERVPLSLSACIGLNHQPDEAFGLSEHFGMGHHHGIYLFA
ncbi:MAG TPA: hypothetical protein PLU97_00045, partial [Candidatus Cryptobacteroides sp.]|nr:hypothetical protein [Candidatus Cryptobacteroides sp.]